MTSTTDATRASDVTMWAIAALVCGAVAILSANVGSVMPDTMLQRLHETRLDGDMTAVAARLTALERADVTLKQTGAILQSRLDLSEQNGKDLVERLGTLETAIPQLFAAAAAPVDAGIDRSITTAGIGETPAENFDVPGGSVSVVRKPIPNAQDIVSKAGPQRRLEIDPAAAPQADARAMGLALGPVVATAQAGSAWRDLSLKMGPLLLGMGPLMAELSDPEKTRLVVGPIGDTAEATDLCQRIEKLAISCMPVPFKGQPLAAD